MELHHEVSRPCRLLSILRTELRLSSTLVGRLKYQNALFVNGQSVFTNHPVAPGDRVLVRLDETPPAFPAEPMALSILYEDEALIALDKPPGCLIHPSASRQHGTLANGLLSYYHETDQRCGIHPVSRLDRDTFGVVVFAKNAHIHTLLAHKIEKTYRATVYGGPEADQGEITLPIARREQSLWREISPHGQPAHTRYRVLCRGRGYTTLELTPLTGRTHQLRLHCMAAGFPILGDPVYQSPASTAFSATHGLTHQQLLAYSVRLCHPLTGQWLSLSTRQAVLPDEIP